VCRKTGSVYGSAEFEAIKEAFLIKSQLTVGERPKRMMLQTANTEERAETGLSLRLHQWLLSRVFNKRSFSLGVYLREGGAPIMVRGNRFQIKPHFRISHDWHDQYSKPEKFK
jgi:hypothetical protein